jgi:hypothetical protein
MLIEIETVIIRYIQNAMDKGDSRKAWSSGKRSQMLMNQSGDQWASTIEPNRLLRRELQLESQRQHWQYKMQPSHKFWKEVLAPPKELGSGKILVRRH